MPRKRKRARPQRDPARGDCFVVVSTEGLFWDGSAWVPRWQDALQFVDAIDPYRPCDALVERLRGLGAACNVAYVPKVAGPEVGAA